MWFQSVLNASHNCSGSAIAANANPVSAEGVRPPKERFLINTSCGEVYIDTPVGGWEGRGDSTLILGAGVSVSRGVPLWKELAENLWKETVGKITPSDGKLAHPFEAQMQFEFIHRWLCDSPKARENLADELVKWWSSQKTPRRLEFRVSDKGQFRADDVFRELMRRALYRNLRINKESDSLGAIARVIRREAEQGSRNRRRLLRVITFNADNLLETEVNLASPDWPPYAYSIAAAYTPPMRWASAIPIYHVHGYLPLERLPGMHDSFYTGPFEGRNIEDGDLIFKDSEYWASLASPLSFANRVVANALHDSRCIFIGLSMTDVNLWRWLGVRTIEIGLGVKTVLRDEPNDPDDTSLWNHITHEQSHEGHIWIRADNGRETDDFLSEFLANQRGIKTLILPSWETSSLEKVLDKLFPSGNK